MAPFELFKKIVFLSCSITIPSLFSDNVFGSENLDNKRLHEMLSSSTTDVVQNPIIGGDGYSYKRLAIQTTIDHIDSSEINECFIKSNHEDKIATLTKHYDDKIATLTARYNDLAGRIERPLAAPGSDLPAIARGNEEVYRRFMNGALVYKPNENNDSDMIRFPFSYWVNPETMRGECDLSRCGNIGQYLSINAGYRDTNRNIRKVEVWITPRFVLQKGLGESFGHYNNIKADWQSDVGILWTYGTWGAANGDCDYLTNQNFDIISSQNLLTLWEEAKKIREHTHTGIVHTVKRENSSLFSIKL